MAIDYKPTFSAVVLTLNEAENLPRCINSLHWCNEVVALDSGSTDETLETAKQLGSRVYVHVQSPPFNIAQQRNWALSNCDLQGDWVLFLDADEVVPEKLAEEILRVCATDEDRFHAYELTPRYLFWGKWLKRTQGFPNWHARLVRKGAARYDGGVWEHFAAGTRFGRIAEPYDHHANSKGFSDWLKRHDRYSSWDAERIAEYIETGRPEVFGTERKRRLRWLAAAFWPFRFIARFFHMYVFRGGFLEGMPALVFCLMYSMYEFMTVVKVIEIRRKKRGLAL
ncbi:MAG: glycosyltransferase family 2 protein [Planctomycetota bacterium]|jgi:glycosyltransferase involved in cell wall biosynthesis